MASMILSFVTCMLGKASLISSFILQVLLVMSETRERLGGKGGEPDGVSNKKKIEESEEAGSHGESNPGHLWLKPPVLCH